MPTEPCCEMMGEHLNRKCEQHPDLYDCPDVVITGPPEQSKWGLPIHDGGHSFISIQFCPFCGKKLPT